MFAAGSTYWLSERAWKVRTMRATVQIISISMFHATKVTVGRIGYSVDDSSSSMSSLSHQSMRRANPYSALAAATKTALDNATIATSRVVSHSSTMIRELFRDAAMPSSRRSSNHSIGLRSYQNVLEQRQSLLDPLTKPKRERRGRDERFKRCAIES